MSFCPNCEAEFSDDDFGIVTCSSCGTVCSIDLDGNVQVQNQTQSEIDSPSETPEPEEEAVEPTYEPEVDIDSEIQETELESELEPFDHNVENPQAEEEPSPFEETVAVAEPLSAASFLEDMELFTENSQGEEFDHLYFDVTIEGFETKEQQDLFVETALDERLNINEQNLKYDEVAGQYFIYKFPMVRLVVLNKRLLDLGLKVSWVLSEDQDHEEFEPEYESGELLEGEENFSESTFETEMSKE